MTALVLFADLLGNPDDGIRDSAPAGFWIAIVVLVVAFLIGAYIMERGFRR